LDRGEENVVHFRRNVDLADQLFRRVQEYGRRVDIALVDGAVDADAGQAPLPRNRVVTARIPRYIDPLLVDILEVFHLVRPGFVQKAFLDPDLHIVRGGHDDVEAVA